MPMNDWDYFEEDVCRCYAGKQHDCSICPLNLHNTGSICTEFAHKNREQAFVLMEEWAEKHSKYNFGDIVKVAKGVSSEYIGHAAIIKDAYAGNFWEQYHYSIEFDIPGWGVRGIGENKLEPFDSYQMPQPKYKIGDIVRIADIDTINRYEYLMRGRSILRSIVDSPGRRGMINAVHVGLNIITYDLTYLWDDFFGEGHRWPEQMLLPVETKREVK